jgi:hypothetical protein
MTIAGVSVMAGDWANAVASKRVDALVRMSPQRIVLRGKGSRIFPEYGEVHPNKI